MYLLLKRRVFIIHSFFFIERIIFRYFFHKYIGDESIQIWNFTASCFLLNIRLEREPSIVAQWLMGVTVSVTVVGFILLDGMKNLIFSLPYSRGKAQSWIRRPNMQSVENSSENGERKSYMCFNGNGVFPCFLCLTCYVQDIA